MIDVTQEQNIIYGLPETADIEEMAELLADVFSRYEPPAVAAGLSITTVREIVNLYGRRAAGDGLTIVARDRSTGKLIGAMLTDDFAGPPPENSDTLPESFAPVAALLDGLDQQYRRIHPADPGQVLHLFMLGVAPDFGGRGIARTLVRLTLANGKKEGYERAITEATGNVSQHVFRALGFVERFHIPYKEFTFRGKRPFESIVGHKSIMLMERSLNAL
ncbi:MAG TPA: GNAT family N-acetyltransferase [Bacteroidota bacterium]|jgi:ribosomal protein S18 acetylase RimI-like enzyme